MYKHVLTYIWIFLKNNMKIELSIGNLLHKAEIYKDYPSTILFILIIVKYISLF